MTAPAKPIILYWDTLSGHSHRVQLFLALTGLPFEVRQLALKQGAHKAPEYLAINPLGKLPAIDDNGTIVTDSNAILVYLASTYDAARAWLPTTPLALADTIRHLSFAAGPLAFGPASARLVNVFGAGLDIAYHQGVATKAFAGLEAELAGKTFLVGDAPSLADVALYSYIAHAPEGGIGLDAYPNIRGWLARIEALPGFVPMQRTPVGVQAA